MKPYTENQLKLAASAVSLEIMGKGLIESTQRHEMFIRGARFAETEFLTEVCGPMKMEIDNLRDEIDRLTQENNILKDKLCN